MGTAGVESARGEAFGEVRRSRGVEHLLDSPHESAELPGRGVENDRVGLECDLSRDFPPAAGGVLGLMSASYAAFSSSPICAANSAGGTLPRAECGRQVL